MTNRTFLVTIHYTVAQQYLIEAESPEHAQNEYLNGELVNEDSAITAEQVDEIFPKQSDLFIFL